MHERQKGIVHLWKQNALPEQQVPVALRITGALPSREEWRLLMDRFLLWLGVTALLAGLFFFVLANWPGVDRFLKLALVGSVTVASLVAYAFGARDRYGNVALLAASLSVGVLLMLVKQNWQEGAATYELLGIWALLIFPWVLASRFPVLWVIWFVVLHMAYMSYVTAPSSQRGFPIEGEYVLAGVVLLGCFALIVWEWFAAQGREWMRDRWVSRLLASMAGMALTALVMIAVVDYRMKSGWYLLSCALVYVFLLAGAFSVYRRRIPDLFMLAGAALSAIVVAVTVLIVVLVFGFRLFFGSLGVFVLLTGVFFMFVTAGLAWWLQRVAREMKGGQLTTGLAQAPPFTAGRLTEALETKVPETEAPAENHKEDSP